MDRVFVSLILLDEIAAFGIATLMICVGGVIGAVLLDVTASFRRVTYLWFVALNGLALTIWQFLWFLAPKAAEAGLFSALAITVLGGFVLFGVALYYSSAARSRHIRGDSKRAWLGFVPFVNFWLVLKAGPTPVQRTRLTRFVIDPLLVTGAILLLVFSSALGKSLEFMSFDTWETLAFKRLLLETQSVEDGFALVAEVSGAELPLRIDEATTMVAVEAEAETLRIIYEVEGGPPNLPADFEAEIAQIHCAADILGPDIARGGTVVSIYRGRDGEVFEAFEITQSDCAAGAI